MEGDAEIKDLLRQNLEVAEENNAILKQMVKVGRVAFWGKVVLWAVVLILPLLLIGPLLEWLSTFTGGTGSTTTLFGMPSAEQFKQVLDAYQGNLPE